jgi:hypothetical protein
MKKLLVLLCAAAVGALAPVVVAGRVASASAPTRVAFFVDRTVPSPFFTSACGFDVSITLTGVFTGTVFYDQSGAIAREVDTQPGAKESASSTTTGKSFSFPFSTVFHYEYPNGTAPGSQAIVTATGLADKVPGIPADAGRVVFDHATVLFVDTNGIPIVDFGAPSSTHGHSNSAAAATAAVCSALAS